MRPIMRKAVLIASCILFSSEMYAQDALVWPKPPDKPRIKYVKEIALSDISLKTGLLGKFKKLIAGNPEISNISLPFDLVKVNHSIFLTCQNMPYLVELDLRKDSFHLFNDDSFPFRYPIAICRGGNDVLFVTDSESKAVYKYSSGRVRRFISEGLSRPTGIAADRESERIYIVDTGDHQIKVFDYDGEFLMVIGNRGEFSGNLNYPTFAAAAKDGSFYVNDALNYKIKHFSVSGDLLDHFGSEGNGPGTFSRPKGIAVDSENHIYVVDNLFDNIQIFDSLGTLLAVVGTSGQNPGQFWSPAGIDIVGDTVYIADTFNDRIQIMRYLGEGSR
jgi:sugar lactone lactonase YvrE